MLVRDIDVMLHVLVLQQELPLIVEVSLHWLSQVQGNELVRLYLLSVSLTRALHWDLPGPFSPRMQLHALSWRGLSDESKSSLAADCSSSDYLILGE